MLEKYNQPKRIGSSMRIFNFSLKIRHICYVPIATRHARSHKECYSPRAEAVSTKHLLDIPSRIHSSANFTWCPNGKLIFNAIPFGVPTRTNWFYSASHRYDSKKQFSTPSNFIKIQNVPRRQELAAGGEPSTRFPPVGLVKTARILECFGLSTEV